MAGNVPPKIFVGNEAVRSGAPLTLVHTASQTSTRNLLSVVMLQRSFPQEVPDLHPIGMIPQ